MKRRLALAIVLFSAPLYSAFAQVHINIGLPGLSAAPQPNEFIAQLYNFALMISGVLALGAIIFGGVKYMTAAGNPSGQTEGKEWIQGAISGLLLLFGAYFILNIINPDLTKLSLPALSPIPAGGGSSGDAGGGSPAGLGLSQQQSYDQFRNAGVAVNGPIRLAGLKQGTVDEVIRLTNACKAANASCEVTVTSATGGEHESGAVSHANGYKVDLRSRDGGSALTNYIRNNYQQLPDRSDGAKMYRAPSGAIYALESNHWDVVVPPR
ncbi:MAG: hypothetical protein HY434_02595 [Candidatus Liptonbacteria bacterium]|nr:hypothetical protein [Candidatus Liptonbacteria bacterium]